MTSLKSTAMAALLALNAAALPAWSDAAQIPQITVSGEGRVEAAPDLATLSLGVSRTAATAAEALSATNRDLAAVLEQLKAAGFEPRDLQTSGLRLGPTYSFDDKAQERRLTGYEAANGLSVRVRDLTALGGLLDQVVAQGANTFNGLEFSLSDPSKALDEARVLAVREARRKAEMMAEAAGVKLGDVLSMSENHGGRQPQGMVMMARAAPESDVAIAEGEVSYEVGVTMVFALDRATD